MQKVRPFFLRFVPAVMARGVPVAIVTFSSQTNVIRQVLEATFGPDAAKEIPIRGNDGSWIVMGKSVRWSFERSALLSAP